MCPPGCYHNGFMAPPELGYIYINDLPNCLNFTIPRMFADDTYLTISGKKYFQLQNGTNHDVENVRQWLLANKLSLNSTKTEFLIFGSDYNLANLGLG